MILASQTMTWYIEKMTIFTRCMCSFMSNSQKISWMVSSLSTFTYIVFTYVGPCIVCCFPPCRIVSGPESKKKNKFNSLHRYFIFKQYRLWCQNKEKCLYPYPDIFCQSTNTYSFFYWLFFYPDYFLSSTNSAKKRNKIGNLCPSIDFSNFSCMFLNPNIFFHFQL